MNRIISIFYLLCFSSFSIHELMAQSDTIPTNEPIVALSGFLDTYYVYDFNMTDSDLRQPFLFNHNRHNQINLNLGFIKVALMQSDYRANFALHAGTYSNDNYSAEPGVLKSIFEANIGISLNKKRNLWLDTGIFPSHIGFEAAVSSDNWTLTRSLLAESSPYFLTGAKLTYCPVDQLTITGLVLNGWQRIQRLQGNSLPAFGTQLVFQPSESIILNWSSFVGTDDPDSSRRMRYFNNFYGQFMVNDKIGFIGGFDIGTQQTAKESSDYVYWLSPIIIGKYNLSKSWKTALRLEYFQDENGVIIPKTSMNGFKTTGVSLNIDYSKSQNLLCRIEGRWLKSKDNLFYSKNRPSNVNFIIAASVALKFSEEVGK